MELFEHFIKIIKQRREDVKELMASGAIDSMERYQYMLGQVRTYESLLQEISTLLNKKEQNEKGTGKHPGKKYGRRLYTDENPRDTVKIKFATPTDARKTVAKVKKISKPFARKIQILTVMEQRAKVMGKTEVAAIAKRGKEAIRKGRK